MSKRMVFGTEVTSTRKLKKACDRMRQDNIQVTGPRLVGNYPGRDYQQVDAQVVKLPGWYGDCAFVCDETGELNGDMIGDNESPYYDERPVDKRTGDRVDKDPKTGRPYRVHPKVLAGEKLPGDDGNLGDIRHYRRLISEYAAVGLEEESAELGGTIAYKEVNQETGELELAIDYPDSP